jgi:ABC-type phosphate transport system ATPase subunit
MADEWNDQACVLDLVETLEQDTNLWQALKERLGVAGAHEAGGASQGL